MTRTFGQTFFDQHVAYLMERRVEEMVEETYTENGILYNAFPFLPEPPPHVFRGRRQLIEAFNLYLDYQGVIQVESVSHFLETEDTISFQAVLRSEKTGRWAVGDIWMLESGRIARHFGFAHSLNQ